MIDSIFFYIFATIILAGGLLTITQRNAVHSAIFLITTLMGTAGLFLHLHAEFLAGVQIILYVGGVMVLYLFVIMLVNLDQAAKERQFNRQWAVAIAATMAVAAELAYFLYRGKDAFHIADRAAAAVSTVGNVEQVADSLFSEYLLPFEIASVLLLVAVVGSVVMAKKRI